MQRKPARAPRKGDFGGVLGHKSDMNRLWIVAVFAALSLPAASAPRSKVAAITTAEAAAEAAEAAMIKRFEPLEIEDALVDQAARIAAAVAALPAHPGGAETVVLAVGGEGYQAIFGREARHAADVLAARSGGPALVLSNTPEQVETGLLASRRTVPLALAALGRRARSGDTIVVYLASHGGEDASISMEAPYLGFAPFNADDLASALATSGFKRRIIIISACFAASWIDRLASPTTIVIAAAAADRTSFGCDDSRELTVFGEAILGELNNPGLSLAAAFDRAQQRIAATEAAEAVEASLPEARVGADMAPTWSGAGASVSR
jgi:hypothetical protein